MKIANNSNARAGAQKANMAEKKKKKGRHVSSVNSASFVMKDLSVAWQCAQQQ